MQDTNVHRHSFDERIPIELKDSSDNNSISAFKVIVDSLKGEGDHYSINRESFIRFFNELSDSEQKEFLSMIGPNGKSIYDLAQEFRSKKLGLHRD